MTVRASSWQYAPRPGLATVAVLGAWAASAVPLLLILAVVLFSGPWDPDDLSPQMWQAQAEEFAAIRSAALIAITPFVTLALTATIGGLLRRWTAPLTFAAGLWLAVGVIMLAATFGLNQSIDISLERAAQPPRTATVAPSPPPAATFTTDEIQVAVREGVERSISAVTGPVILADGTSVAVPDTIPVACERGGTAAAANVVFRTGDNLVSEDAILTAWETNGFTRDRAAGTNLLYGNETDPISRATLRGSGDGLLHLTIESRCATR